MVKSASYSVYIYRILSLRPWLAPVGKVSVSVKKRALESLNFLSDLPAL
jgi:hypothetical protein